MTAIKHTGHGPRSDNATAMNERVSALSPAHALSHTLVQRHPIATTEASTRGYQNTHTHREEVFQTRRHVQRIALAAFAELLSSFSSCCIESVFLVAPNRAFRARTLLRVAAACVSFALRLLFISFPVHLTRSVDAGRSRRRWSFSSSHLRKRRTCRLCPQSGTKKKKMPEENGKLGDLVRRMAHSSENSLPRALVVTPRTNAHCTHSKRGSPIGSFVRTHRAGDASHERATFVAVILLGFLPSFVHKCGPQKGPR